MLKTMARPELTLNIAQVAVRNAQWLPTSVREVTESMLRVLKGSITKQIEDLGYGADDAVVKTAILDAVLEHYNK